MIILNFKGLSVQLVINSYGAYLKKSGECFVIKNEDKVTEVSPRKVESILITTSAYLSTDAIKLAMDNNIDVVFLDHFGNPYGRVWHSKLGSTTLIRRRQLEISESEQGLDLAKQWVATKVSNQAEFLDRLSRPREDKAEKLKASSSSLKEITQKLGAISGSLDERRGTIMGLEGAAGRIYFELLSHVMPERFRFDGRSRNPAKDEFNSMLNYGYGVLYSLVEKGCILAGLDPYIGFVHTDNYNKKSLVFDLIELFRIYAEEPVVFLFSGRKVKVEYFDRLPNDGVTLNKEGKAFFIEALNKHLDESIRYGGRNIQRRNTIQKECHRIANSFIEVKA